MEIFSDLFICIFQGNSLKQHLFQAVVGFLAGGLVWFAVPFGLATTMSLAYHGLSSAQGTDILTKGEISRVNHHITNEIIILHIK